MTSFFEISELTLVLRRYPDGIALTTLASELHMLEPNAERLVRRANEVGVVDTSVNQLVTLTPVGNSLGGAMEERLSSIEPRAIASFVPYTSYVPERWWP